MSVHMRLHSFRGLALASLASLAMDEPLGAFYRVNAFRLDDMQSAISELYGIAASSVVHEGWQEPRVVVRGGERMTVIERPPGARLLGIGHRSAAAGAHGRTRSVRADTSFAGGEEWGRPRARTWRSSQSGARGPE